MVGCSKDRNQSGIGSLVETLGADSSMGADSARNRLSQAGISSARAGSGAGNGVAGAAEAGRNQSGVSSRSETGAGLSAKGASVSASSVSVSGNDELARKRAIQSATSACSSSDSASICGAVVSSSLGAAVRRRASQSLGTVGSEGAGSGAGASGLVAGGSTGLAGKDKPLIGVAGGVFSGAGATVSGTKRAPHFSQNTLSTLLGVLHIGQIKPDACAMRAPQLLQNLLPSRF